MTMNQQDGVERLLGYSFRDKGLLRLALTHASASHDAHNERMEFLGDAVLQIVVSRTLYDRYPHAPEGKLSLYRQHIVCRAALARVAGTLGLSDLLMVEHGMKIGEKMLADATEALLAAVYLDAGDGCEGRVKDVILTLFADELRSCEKEQDGDYKTRLQQLVEQGGSERLDYRVRAEEGPKHEPTFIVEALLNSNVIGVGRGHSKPEAEQAAARKALSLFDPEFSM